MRRTICLFALLGVGCSYTVDDGRWTYEWRTHGQAIHDTALLRSQSCDEGTDEEPLLSHLRVSRLRACAHSCAASGPAENEACTLRCDAGLELVSARCEPRTHEEVWNPIVVAH